MHAILEELAEFRNRPQSLSQLVFWGAMIEEGLIVNRNGSFQTAFRYLGPDFDSATQEEIVVLNEQINNILKGISGEWAIYIEAQRRKSQSYRKALSFPDPVSKLIEKKRYDYFSQGEHYETYNYITLIYMPPPDSQIKLVKVFESGSMDKDVIAEEHVQYFKNEADKICNLFADILPRVQALTGEEMLTYLHSTVSPEYYTIKMPEAKETLNTYLATSDFYGGDQLQLGDHYAYVISMKGYPGSSIPGLMDALDNLDFEFRFVTRFIFMDRHEAEKEANAYMKSWDAKRESIAQVAKNFFFKTETTRYDQTAITKSKDAEAAVYEINNDISIYGYHTACVVVMDKDINKAKQNANEIYKRIKEAHIPVEIEAYNATEAFLGSIPGNCCFNPRMSMLSSRNLCHLLPLSAKYAGPSENKQLNGPVLLYTETSERTPFRFDPFPEDEDQSDSKKLGNMLVLGPPGAGKSVLLDLMGAQFRKYGNANAYYFDCGGSSRVLTTSLGGKFFELAAEKDNQFSFQVLAHVDQPNERTWSREWLINYIQAQGLKTAPEHTEAIWNVLTSMADNPSRLRTITTFQTLIGAKYPAIAEAVQALTERGPYGKIFDGEVDTFHTGGFQGYEMETLLDSPSIVEPTLSYIFHRIDNAMTGAPHIIFMDEYWRYMKSQSLVNKVEQWIRTLRKKNAFVVFASQSLSDVIKSPIAAPLMDCCPNKIYLPNPNALEEDMIKMYNSLGLNAAEISMIATGIQRRDYFYSTSGTFRRFSLALSKEELAFCGSTSKEDQIMAEKILQQYGQAQFPQQWLIHKNLPGAAEEIKSIMEGFN